MGKAGRPKGSGNKPLKRLLADQLAKKYGAEWSPVMELAETAMKLKEIAEESGETADYRAAGDLFDKTSAFLVPKLKATEISTGDSGLTVSIQRKKYDGSASNKAE
tara:strand:- start:593 stop:910 length:318 start_codon:yes stop_codon:yes gene_type:complete